MSGRYQEGYVAGYKKGMKDGGETSDTDKYVGGGMSGAARGIVERLRFDAARCELQFSKGVADNIEEGIAEIERLRSYLGKTGTDWLEQHQIDRAEIERLKAALDFMEKRALHKEQEIERLRAF